MKKRLMITTAAAVFAATMAFGQSQQDSILTQLTDQGYTNIQIKVGTTTLKIEAVRDGMKREFTVDIATGTISNDHSKPVGGSDSGMVAIGGGDDSSDDSNDSSDDSEDDDSNDSHRSNSSSRSSNSGSHDSNDSNDSEDDD